MVVHRGVIKGNTVVLTDLPELPDGTEVEVHLRPAPPDFSGLDEEAAEDAFEQYLLRAGMIKRIPPRLPDPPGVDRTPVEIEGRPL